MFNIVVVVRVRVVFVSNLWLNADDPETSAKDVKN